jgi:hypothetical protein
MTSPPPVRSADGSDDFKPASTAVLPDRRSASRLAEPAPSAALAQCQPKACEEP